MLAAEGCEPLSSLFGEQEEHDWLFLFGNCKKIYQELHKNASNLEKHGHFVTFEL